MWECGFLKKSGGAGGGGVATREKVLGTCIHGVLLNGS